MVTAEVAEPLATTGLVPVMVELPASAAPGLNITEPSAFTTGVDMERILDSALKELSKQVDTPEESVAEHVP